MDKVFIYGAGGHARVVADAIGKMGHEIYGFVTDKDYSKDVTPALGVVAIGSSKAREAITQKLIGDGKTLLKVIHPSAVVSENVEISEGAMLIGNAVVNVGSKIGRSAIINTGATVDHDCTIGDWVHIAPGAHLCGNVSVGEGTWVCVGASVIPGIKIGSWAMIGAGAVVIRDVPNGATVVGCPAKRIK